MAMNNSRMKQARKEQTELEFTRLKTEVEKWWTGRVKDDKQKQYRTQLAAIKGMVESAVDYLTKELSKIDLKMPEGQFYEECRRFDLRVIWLRKVWDFYREKFDQRDDDELKPLLLAADEVVWGCYQQLFRRAPTFALQLKSGPAPLPFIETSYSPESFPSELVPYDLKPSEVGFLQTLMNKLPIPLVSLPQACVTAPWWLVYVGHEVGHHIQYELADQRAFVKLFEVRIQNAVKRKCGNTDEIEKWGRWGKEIFADVFSVLTMGQWAVRAMLEFEMQQPQAMLTRRPQYPSPVIRLHLLAHIANSLGLDGTAELRGLNVEEMVKGNPQAERDYSFVEEIVKEALSTEVAPNVTLTQLIGFLKEDFQPGGDLSGWSAALRTPNPSAPAIGNLRDPRLIAGAALAAWSELTEEDEERRKLLRNELAANTIRLIAESREPGDRSESVAAVDSTDFGSEIAKQLMNAKQQELVA